MCVLILAGLATFPGVAQAQPAVVERDDGTVVLRSEGLQFVLPRNLADAVAAAARDHRQNPPALQEAIAAILTGPADCVQDAEAGQAVAAFAVFHVRGRSAPVDAILQTVLNSCPGLSGDVLLAALPAVSPRARDAAGEQLAQLRATVENPSQISPVE